MKPLFLRRMPFAASTGTTLLLILALLAVGCGSRKQGAGPARDQAVAVSLDLVNIDQDRVRVTVRPGRISQDTITYVMAKIIPGTYAIHDYGRYLEEFEARDASGNLLPVEQTSVNTWRISSAARLSQVTYLVNDTFDQETSQGTFEEGSTTIFSPAGTNILEGANFVLNMCGFAGYFQGRNEAPYTISISHPENLNGVTALNDQDAGATADLFHTRNYAEMVDSPIMYTNSEAGAFTLGEMEVLLAVFSPKNKQITAAALLPDLREMMTAQKHYLGPINTTRKYAVLNYITSMGPDDAKGIGALEHNYSTTGVFRENMSSQELIDVISHEFFHTLTPLNIHSEEIQYFDFLDPKMSRHLWMYEGFTEYFAQHFQVHEGLLTDEQFMAVIMDKINTSKSYNDSLSFTEMSLNVLDPAYKPQYPNVYMKGALMGMCMDIIIREQSGGKRSLLSVMGELSEIYGPQKPFKDPDLIPRFTALTYPEIGAFIDANIVRGGVIDYDSYLARMGYERVAMAVEQPIAYLSGPVLYVKSDPTGTKFIATLADGNNRFYQALGIQEDDIFVEVNGTPINPKNARIDASIQNEFLVTGYKLPVGSPITIKVLRAGERVTLSGEVVRNFAQGEGYTFSDSTKSGLRNSWLYH